MCVRLCAQMCAFVKASRTCALMDQDAGPRFEPQTAVLWLPAQLESIEAYSIHIWYASGQWGNALKTSTRALGANLVGLMARFEGFCLKSFSMRLRSRSVSWRKPCNTLRGETSVTKDLVDVQSLKKKKVARPFTGSWTGWWLVAASER